MKFAHISFGPNCVPAEILKASGLRTCTFGFDWFRSSSFFVEEFFNRPLSSFLDKYVMNPCIPLRQRLDMVNESSLLHTIEPQVISPYYGYSYLYNPHRVLDNPLNEAYFERSFVRLRQAIEDRSAVKRYVVADYINKEYATHLNKIEEIIDWFKCLSLTHGLSSEIYIVRILLDQDKSYNINKFKIDKTRETTIYMCNVQYWEELDKEEIRHYAYKKLGQNLFGKLNKDNLWTPTNA